MAKRKKGTTSIAATLGGAEVAASEQAARGGGGGGGSTPSYPSAVLGGAEVARSHRAATATVPLTASPSPTAPVAGPSRTETKAYRRAARQQAAVIQKYAYDNEETRLEKKHYEFDQHDRITKVKATREQIHTDLAKSRENVKTTTKRLYGSPRVYKANLRGKVLGPKKIERIDASRIAKQHKYNLAVQAPERHRRQRGELDTLTNVTIPKLQKRQQRLSQAPSPLTADFSLTGPTELDRKKRLAEVESKLGAAQSRATHLSGLVRQRRGRRAPQITPTEAILAFAGAVPPLRLGSVAWKAAVAARGLEGGAAVTTQAVRAAAQKLVPQSVRGGAAKVVEALGQTPLRYAGKVPGIRGIPRGLERHPYRTLGSTSLKGGLAAGAALHPSQAGDLGGDVAKWAADFPEYEKRFGDVAHFFGTTPEALLKTGEELLSSGEARRQTIFGARDLALGATAFPFLTGYEAITEGPGEALDTFTHSVKHDFRSSIGPALRGDWDTFQARMERPGLGGAAVPLSFLVPGAAALSRGALKLTQSPFYMRARMEGATHAQAVDAATAAIGKRKPFRYGKGEGMVQEYPRGSRGIVGAALHGGHDLLRAMAQSRRKPGSKNNVFPREGESAPLLHDFPINKYRRGRHASRIPVEEDIAGAFRGRQLRTLHHLAARNSNLFSYAIELGLPKDAPSMIRALEAKIVDIKRNPSAHPSAATEIPGIEKLIKKLKRNPGKMLSDRFKRDVAHGNTIVQYMQEQAPWLETETTPGRMAQTEVRAYAEQTEQLAKRPDSRLPSLEEVAGPEATWETHGREYVRKVGKEAIDAEARRQGLGQPGYFPAYEKDPRPISVTKSQSTRGLTPKESHGILAREGARDMSNFRLTETMHRLNRTISEVKSGDRVPDELARDPAEILSALEGKEVTREETTGLSAQKVTERLAKAGMDLSRIQLFNAKALDTKFKTTFDNVERAHGLEDLSVDEINHQVDQLITEATIKGKDALKGKKPNVEADKDWMIIGNTELTQFRGRFRPFGHLGEAPLPIAQVWTRAKTLASKYLLAHPSWFAFQGYANAYLAGMAEPGSLIATGYRDFLNSMTDIQRQNFERAIGIPIVHPDVGAGGGSLIAGWTGFTRGAGRSDFYQRHLAGKNPLDALFRAEAGMEHFFKGKVLYTKARREAYRRMGGTMNRMMTTMDKFTGGRLNTLEDYQRAMNDLLNDPKEMERFAKDTSSFMGDYAVFNAKERTYLANNILFYGFIRHSLMLSLYTLPVKHPIRTGLIGQMGSMVNKEQKKMITSATRDWLREYMLHLGYSPERATFFSGQFKLRDDSIPLSMLGSFYLPDGTVIDLKRASFAGSLPTEIKSPWQLLSAFNPIGTFIFESITGIDTYTGQPIQTSENYRYAPGFSREDPNTPGADTLWGNPEDLAKYAGVSALSYFAPIRELSDAVSTLPYNERTALSFPLPGPVNPFPEEQFIRKTAETQGRRAINKQIQYEAKHGWRSITPELFPFMPHETAAIPGLAMSWLYDIGKKSERINARQAKAEKKKPEPQGYKATTLPGDEGSGYKDVLLPGEKPPSEKKEETTYAESMYKVLKNVFDVKEPGDRSHAAKNPGQPSTQPKVGRNTPVVNRTPAKPKPKSKPTPEARLVKGFMKGVTIDPELPTAKDLGVKHDKVVLEKIHPELQKALIKLGQQTGVKPEINEGFRTRSYQQVLYDRLHDQGGAVADPGMSAHEQGLAVDITNYDAYTPEQLRKAGVVQSELDIDDPEHLTLVNEPAPLVGPGAPAQPEDTRRTKVVTQRLTKAARRAQPRGGGPTADGLNDSQTEFGSELAKLTGLDPQTIGAWMLQEQNFDAADAYASADYHNYLNVQPTVAGGDQSTQSHDPQFSDPKTAAQWTYEWMKGNPDTPGGGAADTIKADLAAAQQANTPEEQAAIIGSTDPGSWGTGSFAANLSQVSVIPGQKGKPIPKGLKAQAQEVLGKKQTQQIIQSGGVAPSGGPPSVKFKNEKVPLKGPYSGSRALVRLITGAPHLRGDHGGTKFGEPPGVHSATGDHYRPDGYAQDINDDNPRENEPPFSQETMDTVVANLRALGAKDVPDLQIGQGGTWEVQGYEVYVEPVSNHIHVGAHPIGEPPGSVTVDSSGIASAGTVAGTTATGTVPSTGTTTTAPSTGGFTPPVPGMKPAKEPKPKFSQAKLLKAIGEDQGFNQLFGGEPPPPADEDATMAAMAEIAATRKRLLRR